MNIENVILSNLQYNEDFARKVLPFLKKEYFSSPATRECFDKISSHFNVYNSLPTKSSLVVDVQSSKMSEDVFNSVIRLIDSIEQEKNTPVDTDWLMKNTEEYCKDRALSLAIQQAVDIADGFDKNLTKTAIPEILSKALSLSFDKRIGHDYIDDAEERYNFYTSSVSKIPFSLTDFNTATDGGVERKTLNVVSAVTGGGKSLFLTNIAADYMRQGYNVLYISLEMAEEKLAQRIDANLLNIQIQELKNLPRDVYLRGVEDLGKKYSGKIKIVEYPPNSVHTGHIRYLLREYKQKYNFIPDIVMVDYLGICASSRLSVKNVNSYQYFKSVAEELRGLAIEENLVVWTALQLNRGSMGSSDVGMENTSDSIGGPFTFDFFFSLIVTEEMIKRNQVTIKQLKSRYGDINKYPKFNLGLDRAKMRFYNIATSPTQPMNAGSVVGVKPTTPNKFKNFS